MVRVRKRTVDSLALASSAGHLAIARARAGRTIVTMFGGPLCEHYRPGWSGQTVPLGSFGRAIRLVMVFRDDGAAHQLGTMGGSIGSGRTVALSVPVGT